MGNRPKTPPGEFSKSEQEVIDLIMRGLDNQDISNKRFTSYSATGSLVSKIFKKMNVTSRTDFIISYASGNRPKKD